MAREWTRLNFGKKYKGKTLPWIIFHDPDWFFWACEQRDFFKDRALREEAEELYQKSTHIRIPQKKRSERRMAEYGFRGTTGGFANLEIVAATRPEHEGSTDVFRLPVIDLSVAHGAKNYDKLGCRILMKTVKFVLFGDESCRMTKGKCEEFFDNEDNFL